jgi:hypothetical protein
LTENINNLTNIGKQLIFKESGDDIEQIKLHIALVNDQLNSVYESLAPSKIDYFSDSIIELCDIEELDSVIASKISELSKTDLNKYFEHKVLQEETSELTLFSRNEKPLYTLLREAKLEFSKLVTSPIENAARIGEAASEIKEYAEKLESKVDSAIVKISDQLLDFKGIFTPYITEKPHKLDETSNKETEEVLLKEKEISALKLAHEKACNELISLQSKAKQLEGTLASLKAEEKNDAKLVEPETFSNLVEQSLLNKKSDPELCFMYIENKYSHVVVLPSAYKSIKESSEFKRTPRMLILLKALAEEYAPAIINGTPDSEAKGCFSHGAYKANESYPVSSNKRLMKYRTFRYNNKPVVMEQHIGIGTSHNKQETIRIYFKIIDEKIIIGYAGAHLPNE